MIWPFRVIQELAISCFKNKKQHLAIVPTLRDLGDLCLLRRTKGSGTLLMNALKDVLQSENYELIEGNMDNIALFITECCKIVCLFSLTSR